MTQSTPSVFASYTTPDRPRVEPLVDYLQTRGFDVWIEYRNIKPGQNWDFEIKRALAKASFVLPFISGNSVDRRGYVQRELQLALDKRSEKLIEDIYIIPVLLDDDVPVPEQLKDIQFVRARDPDCKERIAEAIGFQMQRLGVERREAQQKEGITWDSRAISESWDGIPG